MNFPYSGDLALLFASMALLGHITHRHVWLLFIDVIFQAVLYLPPAIQEEKQVTEGEMVGWHHQLSGHEFEQTPENGEGQENLGCCSPRRHKESDTMWLSNNKCLPSPLHVVLSQFLEQVAFPPKEKPLLIPLTWRGSLAIFFYPCTFLFKLPISLVPTCHIGLLHPSLDQELHEGTGLYRVVHFCVSRV